MSSLSPRSSLSSLSPPCSPMVTDAGGFLPGEAFVSAAAAGGLDGAGGSSLGMDLDLELHSRLAALELSLDPREQTGLAALGEGDAKIDLVAVGEKDSSPQVRGMGAGPKKMGVTSAVSDESVAGDSGVYEPSERRPPPPADLCLGYEDTVSPGCSQVQLGMKYDARDQRFTIFLMQLTNCSALCLPEDQHMYVRVAVLPCSEPTRCLFRSRPLLLPADRLALSEVFVLTMAHNALRQKTLRLDVCRTGSSSREQCLAGAQVSLADVSSSGEKTSQWYNLLNHAHLPDSSHPGSALRDQTDPQTTDCHSDRRGTTAEQTGSTEVEGRGGGGGEEEEDDWREEGDLFEDEERAGHGEEEEEFYPDNSQWEEEEQEEEGSVKPPQSGTMTEKVNKETSMVGVPQPGSVVRPKERRHDFPQQNPFVRGNTIIRSKTFSPGPQSQYICRINRSDSDSSTLSKRSPFVRNASERRSMRMKKPPVPVKGLEGVLRTSLDLELDLAVSRTRRARLDQELGVLRELREQLEAARRRGTRELPAWVQEDERFRLFLRQAEKQTHEEQVQEQRVEKMMRAAAKDVHKISGQSRKEDPEVQTFREKMAFFTRAKSNIPVLPAHDV